MGRIEEEMEEDEEEEMSDFGVTDSSEDDNRVMEWEIGLPSGADLMPLSQRLIPPELASAFSISPEPRRSAFDVNRASQDTFADLRRHRDHPNPPSISSNGLKSLPPVECRRDEAGASESRNGRKSDVEEADLAPDDHQSARTSKRPRLVWTAQLHKRFVDAVAHLGIKNAFPKTIMQLMNVEGLSRENVASHLQKYRLYRKRMDGHGLSTDGSPSSDDQLFATTPLQQSFHEATGRGSSVQLPIPVMPYAAARPQMFPMSVTGMPQYGHGYLGRLPSAGNPGMPIYHGFESHSYNLCGEH